MAHRVFKCRDSKRTGICHPDPEPPGTNELAPLADNVSALGEISIEVRECSIVRSFALAWHVGQKPPGPSVNIGLGQKSVDLSGPVHGVGHAAIISRR